MLRASAGSSATWFSVTMRRIVRSQFSGVARRYEMRDIRPLSSARWQLPHFERTRSFCTGMPTAASGGAADGGGVCARAVPATIATTATLVAQAFRPGHQAALKSCATSKGCATSLCPFMKDPLRNEQRQSRDDARQRHRRAVAAVGLEQIRNLAMLRGHHGELEQIDVADEPEAALEGVLEDDFMSADDRPRFERQMVGQLQVDR